MCDLCENSLFFNSASLVRQHFYLIEKGATLPTNIAKTTISPFIITYFLYKVTYKVC